MFVNIFSIIKDFHSRKTVYLAFVKQELYLCFANYLEFFFVTKAYILALMRVHFANATSNNISLNIACYVSYYIYTVFSCLQVYFNCKLMLKSNLY